MIERVQLCYLDVIISMSYISDPASYVFLFLLVGSVLGQNYHCYCNGESFWHSRCPHQAHSHLLSLSLRATGIWWYTSTRHSERNSEILWWGVLYIAWTDNSWAGVPLWDKGLPSSKQKKPSWLWEWWVEWPLSWVVMDTATMCTTCIICSI